jgi:hypothetical protein
MGFREMGNLCYGWGKGANRVPKQNPVSVLEILCAVAVMCYMLQLLQAGDSSKKKIFCAWGRRFAVAVNKSVILQSSDPIYVSFSYFSG